ncbi:leucine aminopeptidase [Tieghemostelium lacteum]|uniref:Leucine aminopeptidase n=1 Tax=Tieghemostelium lacteum TaxID=361077 RepID=A0A151Z7Z4_TIELA|nr:leucine aminopeptidase [Tieghemostelium lacteum]|eukprot:KYQ90067.1 leucine aminopeptidase [Tieghemostelium lacteum]
MFHFTKTTSLLKFKQNYFLSGKRYMSTATENTGLIVGFFEGGEEFTALGKEINEKSNGQLSKAIKLSDSKGKVGDNLVLFGVTPEIDRLSLVGLGKKIDGSSSSSSSVFEKLDNVRKATGYGIKALKAKGANKITIDQGLGEIRAISEGANLSNFKFDFKTNVGKTTTDRDSDSPVDIQLHQASSSTEWLEGKVVCEAQNFARILMESPSNLMTPTIFVEKVQEKLKSLLDSGKVKMVVRDEQWVRENKMGMFWGVAKGSNEPLKFLELHYYGASQDGKDPVVLVGKGITFDSGGISIKPSAQMGLMRGDMGGAATAVSALYGAATLQVPVNLITLTPLCENMPSGHATKPGDILFAMNGKSVEVDNTDAEGRLILGDALHYAHTFKPLTIVDIATLTGAIDVALGYHFGGVFSNSDELWDDINQCGQVTGERMWRMPLAPEYRKQMDSKVADIVNSASRSGSACAAASFLKEFVQVDRWAHMDIAGIMYSNEDGPYIRKGMTGKPTRTLIELVKKISSKK